MTFRKLLLPAAAACLLAVPMTGTAGDDLMHEPGWFIGGGVGANRVEDDQWISEEDDINETNEMYKAVFGLRFNELVSFEGQYLDFGTAEGGNSSVEATGWNASAMVTVPVWILTLHAKGGLLFWESDRAIPAGTGATQTERDGDGEDISYGVGASIALAEWITVRAEYERFEFGNIDDDGTGSRADGVEVDTASLSLLLHF